jgi:hypothetical protein
MSKRARKQKRADRIARERVEARRRRAERSRCTR